MAELDLVPRGAYIKDALKLSLAKRFLCRLKSSSGSSLRLIKIMRRGPIALSLVTFIGIGDDVGSNGETC